MLPTVQDEPKPTLPDQPIQRHATPASVIAVAAELQIGIETGKWIAGDIDGTKLDWSDEAAARRVMAIRAARGLPPAPERELELPSKETLNRVRTRHPRLRWLPLIAAPWIIAAGVALWVLPELQGESTLSVESEQRTVHLDIPVAATVLLNGQKVAVGKAIIVGNLPVSGEVRFRVEAPGHQPYEIAFRSAADVPTQLQIPLRSLY
jgi:hypothetical protein